MKHKIKAARARKGDVLKHRGIGIRLAGIRRGEGKARKGKEHHILQEFFRHRAGPAAEAIRYTKPGNRITTAIDDMLQMVSDRKAVGVDRLAKALRVPESEIEEWAAMLEEQGLVSMHYPPFGKPEVRIGKEKEEE
ncbi:MAG: hypothetical protein FJY76_01020 [Candidatus Aenigmarchaeota archaeon]|nr:hypothetical protein [Candidatus Aenigmarchaeota archaeon]